MMIPRLIPLALAAAFAPAHADEPGLVLNPVVVTGSRVATNSFDMPAAIDVVDGEHITSGQARVNASEALAAVPGLVVQNRQNYAQDLQISSRGFGARSAFGVRGVKLIADGIPATMPDGQGQAATFNLDVAERMEVLRGPFSATYGNHAGGVIQLFTREGEGAPSIEGRVQAGSDGASKIDLTAQGKPGDVGYVINTSKFQTDGYRDHSAASRDQSFAKITADLGEDRKLTLIGSSLTQHDTQDPLGAKWATYQANPRAVDPAAINYNTRKSIDHLQGGATYEQRFGQDSLQVSVYSGTRSTIQFQSIPKSTQVDSHGVPIASSPGGVIDFDRSFYGMGLRWSSVRQAAGGKLTVNAGADYDSSQDDRRGYENYVGSTLGVLGGLRRQETDKVTSFDPYVQADWQGERWGFSGGVRHTRINVGVDDAYLSNGNDSGGVKYQHTTPVVGVVYKASPALNFYASAAKGFEAPTLNEMFYSGSGGTFNYNLAAASSTHLELGAKAFVGEDTRINLAVFDIHTNDELVVDQATGGRTSYKNAGQTLRQGVELSLDSRLSHSLTTRVAITHMRAVFDESFRSGSANTLVNEGSALPGVPRTTAYGELAWKHAPSGVQVALEGVYRSKMQVTDGNQDVTSGNDSRPAPGYAIANLRVTAEQNLGRWKIGEFARLDNLFDRQYIGSVVVGDTNGRYYEAAPGHTWLAGVSARYTF
ncbi:MAG: TonB-dependent receptor [Zoogloea sp.]|nr:TonB-dependent receptor [Zoogloea sp.]